MALIRCSCFCCSIRICISCSCSLIRCTANWRWYSRYSYKRTTETRQLALVLKVLLQTYDRNSSTGAGTQGTPTNVRQKLVNWRWYSRYSYRHTINFKHMTNLSTDAGAQGTPINMTETCQLIPVLKVHL